MTNKLFPPAIFITGTDTDVGKTFVSAVLAAGLGAGYWKPIGAGLPDTDTNWVRNHTKLSADHFFQESYLLAAHLSPHQAAREEDVTINMANIKMPKYKPLPHLIIEGAGGLMVPINDKELILDVVKHLKLPVLVVARSGLGTINHTVLTVEKLRQHSIPVFGVVMNGLKNKGNRQSIEQYANVEVLAEIEPMATITPQSLRASFVDNFGDYISDV